MHLRIGRYLAAEYLTASFFNSKIADIRRPKNRNVNFGTILLGCLVRVIVSVQDLCYLPEGLFPVLEVGRASCSRESNRKIERCCPWPSLNPWIASGFVCFQGYCTIRPKVCLFCPDFNGLHVSSRSRVSLLSPCYAYYEPP